jgi:hypothetical protein
MTVRSAQVKLVATWGIPPFPLVVAIIGFLIPLFQTTLLRDGDTYWHIASGQWILQHDVVPHVDPFSSTAAGMPWVAHEWLSELLMALVFNVGGWTGLTLLIAAVLATTLWLIAHYLSHWLDQPAALVTTVLAGGSIMPSLLARPHIVALVPLVLWCTGLLRAREQQRAPSWQLLPLFVIWANLHGSFVLGLVLAGGFALEAIVEAEGNRVQVLRRWFLFMAAALAASMCTPFGWHSLVYPFQLMQPEVTNAIQEWQPVDFSRLQPLTLILMTLLYVSLTRSLRVPLVRLLMLLGLLYLSLKHGRHQMVAGVVGGMLLAAPMGTALNCAKTAYCRLRPTGSWLVIAIGLVTAATALRLALPLMRSDDRATPEQALSHVPPDRLRQPVFNSYEFGGYLIYRHVRPYVDGRADMYGVPFMTNYISMFAPDPAAFEAAVTRYGVSWAIIAPANKPFLYMLSTLPNWRRLYGDNVAVVYVRER